MNVYPDGHRRLGKGKVHLPSPKPSPAPAPTIEPSPTPSLNEQNELQPEPLPTPQPIPEPRPVTPPDYAGEYEGSPGGQISLNIGWGSILSIAVAIIMYGIFKIPAPLPA